MTGKPMTADDFSERYLWPYTAEPYSHEDALKDLLRMLAHAKAAGMREAARTIDGRRGEDGHEETIHLLHTKADALERGEE